MVERRKITTKELSALRKLREESGKGGWIAITSNKITQNFELKGNKRTQRFQL
jgi:hypothetical protein